MSAYFGSDVPKLGFGMMRLPRKLAAIDIEETERMVDAFLAAGFTYFDTAHIYPGSEVATRKALVERYPRERFTLATKLYAPLARTERGARQQLDTSLEKLGTSYVDYYLLHSLNRANYRKYEKMRLWDFVQEKKAEGAIRHVGFSFHDTPDVLDRILDDHPEVEFVQLQINYADWENPKVASRGNYETARAHGVSIVVMEPLKGGKIADPPASVKRIFDETGSQASYASWGIRFAAGLDGVICVLSGMSTMAQVEDNVSFMRDFRPLDGAERAAVQEAQAAFNASPVIQCAACGYCLSRCPQQIDIPGIFDAMNLRLGAGRIEASEAAYAAATTPGARATSCIACGACERACTQSLPIIDLLARCAKTFDR